MVTARSTNATAASSSSSRRSNRWKYEAFKNSPLLFFFLFFSLFLKSVNTSSSAHANRWKYEVFLSFGDDTRTTFTDHLSIALSDAGINTFVDYQLRREENIQSVLDGEIEGSRIALVIFSKRYAESRWCLRELSKIMSCREDQEGLVVYPIFYDVDPSQVRKQSGSMGEAFRKHEREEDPNEVEQWRKDLKACADLSGRHLKTTADGREGLFIQNVVGDIIALTKTADVQTSQSKTRNLQTSQSSTRLEYRVAWASVPYYFFFFFFFSLKVYKMTEGFWLKSVNIVSTYSSSFHPPHSLLSLFAPLSLSPLLLFFFFDSPTFFSPLSLVPPGLRSSPDIFSADPTVP